MRNKSFAARAFLSYYYRVQQQQQLEKMKKKNKTYEAEGIYRTLDMFLSRFSVVFYLNSYIFHE
jgi:hypothetical protein